MQKRKLDDEGDEDGDLWTERKKSKHTVSAASLSVNDIAPQASLLGLPGELRNQIYGLATVKDTFRREYDNWSEVDDPGRLRQLPVTMETEHDQPGLVRCCRQLRDEASLVFYAENRFEIQIYNGKLVPGPEHWFWTGDISAGNRLLDCRTWGRISWRNIMGWLKMYYERKVSPMPQYDTDHVHAELAACSEAFTLLKDLDGNSWDVIEMALRSFKRGIDAATWDVGTPFDD